MRRGDHGTEAVLEHAGRDPASNYGVVNPPVYHASTIIFPTLEVLLETRRDRASGAFERITYGREGTPMTRGIDPGSKSRSAAVPCQGLVCYPFGGSRGGGQASNPIQNNSGLPQGAGRPAAGCRCGASDSAGRPSERKVLHARA